MRKHIFIHFFFNKNVDLKSNNSLSKHSQISLNVCNYYEVFNLMFTKGFMATQGWRLQPWQHPSFPPASWAYYYTVHGITFTLLWHLSLVPSKSCVATCDRTQGYTGASVNCITFIIRTGVCICRESSDTRLDVYNKPYNSKSQFSIIPKFFFIILVL